MEASTSHVLLIVSDVQKKDLAKRFDCLVDEFLRERVNGSIQLHFSQGRLAKVHSTKVD